MAAEAPLPLPGQHHSGTSSHLRKITPVVSRRSFTGTGKVLAPVVSLVLVIAACAGLYQLWRNFREQSSARAASHISIARSQPAHKTAKPAASATGPDVPASAPSPLDAQAQPASEPPGSSAIPPDSKVSLSLSASETTWLSVSVDGKPVFSGILEPNQSKKLGALERAKVVVGNAGGLSVEWNGKAIGTLGRRGQVRVVSFTPEAYTFLDSADGGHPAHSSTLDTGPDSTR